MISRAIKTLPGTVVVFTFVTAVLGIGLETSAQAQSAGSADSASMAKPPVAPTVPNANGARTYNPDNMPTKRPALPPNSNRMLHNNPASDAIAK
jgi:guanyl-specific ribonuclease Sa